jgi:hypothetical protein
MEDQDPEIEKTELREELRQGPSALHSVTALSGMYQDWFLDYAS